MRVRVRASLGAIKALLQDGWGVTPTKSGEGGPYLQSHDPSSAMLQLRQYLEKHGLPAEWILDSRYVRAPTPGLRRTVEGDTIVLLLESEEERSL